MNIDVVLTADNADLESGSDSEAHQGAPARDSGNDSDKSNSDNEREAPTDFTQEIPNADDSILGFVAQERAATGLLSPLAPLSVAEPTTEQVLAALSSVMPTPVEELDIETVLRKKIRSSTGRAFFVVDLGILREQVDRWRAALPRVEIFYAIKCNPNPVMLRQLAEMGVSFDCASMGEIRTVQRLGVAADRIIFANPVKLASHLAFARSQRVKLMTFDNEEELHKVKKIFPAAHIVLRIATDDSGATSRLSAKFGARPSEWERLVKVAKELGLRLTGVSFHVGSGSQDVHAHANALRNARAVFDMAAKYGYQLSVLDIGGGFPGTDDAHISFGKIADTIRPIIDELFPPSVRVIAEPGRYIASRTHTLAVNIYGKRVLPEHHVYYVDDGVYGSLSCIVWDHQSVNPIPLGRKMADRPRFKSTVFGPTCDSIDCIVKDYDLPDMKINEWFYFVHMGAYTAASACHFNGFLTEKFFYIHSLRKGKRAASTLMESPAKLRADSGRKSTTPARTASPARGASPARPAKK